MLAFGLWGVLLLLFKALPMRLPTMRLLVVSDSCYLFKTPCRVDRLHLAQILLSPSIICNLYAFPSRQSPPQLCLR